MKCLYKITYYIALAALLGKCGPSEFETHSTSVPKRVKTDSKADDTSADAENKNDMNATCGLNISDASAITSNKILSLEPFKRTYRVLKSGGVFYTNMDVLFSGKLLLENSLLNSVISQGVTGVPALNLVELNSFLSGAKVGFNTSSLSLKDREEIGTNFPDWTQTPCALQPLSQLTRSGSDGISIDFSQPIPFGITPTISLTQLVKELSTQATWGSVIGKVVKSSNKNIPIGTQKLGKITALIQDMNSSYASGSKGVKITYDFSGATNNRLLGLPLSAIWIYDPNTKDLSSVELDMGVGQILKFK